MARKQDYERGKCERTKNNEKDDMSKKKNKGKERNIDQCKLNSETYIDIVTARTPILEHICHSFCDRAT